MGSLIVLRPQLPAEIVAHEGLVELEDLYRIIGCDTVDRLTLGSLPTGRGATLWFDDNGLINDAAVNRKINDHFLCGILLICGLDHSWTDTVAFTAFEARLVLATAQCWPLIPADAPKPWPAFEFIAIDD